MRALLPRRLASLATVALLLLLCLGLTPVSAQFNVYTYNFLRRFSIQYAALREEWTGGDYCVWPGVTCAPNGEVYVNLRGRGLVGNMPQVDERDAQHVRVVSVDLSDNPDISGEFQRFWRSVTQLRLLNLSFTSLRGTIPDDWSRMTALEEIYIRNTAACQNLPKWSATSLPNLRRVDFSYNNFHGSLRSEWSSFVNLESLQLRGNTGFCDCIPTSWNGMPVLSESLEGLPVASAMCAYNKCKKEKLCHSSPNPNTDPETTTAPTTPPTGPTQPPTPPPMTEATRTVLQFFARNFPNQLGGWVGPNYCAWDDVICDANGDVTVDLSGRGLGGYAPDLTGKINGADVRIVALDLSCNPHLYGTFPSSWSVLKQLRTLDLSTTALSGTLPDSWSLMSSIVDIRVTRTNACAALPGWIMPTLRRVNLSHNAMTGGLAASWWRMTNLVSVDITGNDFCGCMQQMWWGYSLLTDAVAAANPEMVAPGCRRRCGPASLVCQVPTEPNI